VAGRSGCQKSKRGVVIFVVRNAALEIIASGCNAQPYPWACDGSPRCRELCNKLCVHAEADALYRMGAALRSQETHLLHVKIVHGAPVPSGPPSCWQCSRAIVKSSVDYVWLLHQDGLKSYTAEDFHRITLANNDMIVGGDR
jgi:deoxycytidylate deaminase